MADRSQVVTESQHGVGVEPSFATTDKDAIAKPFSLLRLPRELRDMIYKLTIVDTVPLRDKTKQQCSLALLQTNRQIRQEAMLLLLCQLDEDQEVLNADYERQALELKNLVDQAGWCAEGIEEAVDRKCQANSDWAHSGRVRIQVTDALSPEEWGSYEAPRQARKKARARKQHSLLS